MDFKKEKKKKENLDMSSLFLYFIMLSQDDPGF